MNKLPDDADRAKAGTLPADPATDTVRAAPLRVVQPGEQRQADEPAALESERALLAALLWAGANAPDTLRVSAVSDILESGEAFYRPNSGAIYDAMRACAAANAEHDPVAVHTQLVRTSGATSLSAIQAIMNDASTVSERQARVYAEAIRDAWTRRKMIADAKQIIEAARSSKVTYDELLSQARSFVDTAAQRSSDATSAIMSVNQAGIELVQRMMTTGNTAMSTGLKALDLMMNGGVRPGEVSIVAARTSVGKSTLAAQIAEHVVTEDTSRGVLYVSLEMKATSLLARLVSARSGVPLTAIRKNELTSSQWSAFHGGMASITGKGLYFADNPTQTMGFVYATARRLSSMLAREGRQLAMVVIDHIGLVKPSAETAKRGSREQQVAETSRAQRYIASEFNCHVIGLAQILREAEKNNPAERIPKIHQIRESGAIEQDADSVLILHRDKNAHGKFEDFYEDDYGHRLGPKPAALVLGKARSDETGVMLLRLDAAQGSFRDWDGEGGFGDHFGSKKARAGK